MPISFRRVRRLGAPTLLVLVASCSHGARSTPARPVECHELRGGVIPAAAIGLPTRGATVTSADVVPPSGSGATAIGEWCRVTVAVRPVDPAAPAIELRVNLPARWNGKALMVGGGGYDGVWTNNGDGGRGNYFNGPTDRPVPLGQGYATFASDSGHAAGDLKSADGSFARNDEALGNYLGDALKKARDVAVKVIAMRYGRPPARTYFVGASTGGREALVAVTRWPEDFDGAISQYPAWNAGSHDLQLGRITRALRAPGAYPDGETKLLWMTAVLKACDGLDGLEDGIVSDVAGCRFDPRAVACADGSAAKGCATAAHVAALSVMNTPISIAYETGSGERGYPGINVFSGADLTGALDLNEVQPSDDLMRRGPADARYGRMPYGSVFWDQWVKHFVTRDPQFDSLELDPEHPGVHEGRVRELLGRQDVNSTALGPFARRGGKLILMHGLADGLVSWEATAEYHRRLVAALGADEVRSFVRFFTIPGLGHVLASPAARRAAATVSWDPLGALEAWVERDRPPAGLVVSHADVGMRPVCEYPRWPRYRPPGDPRSAASFECFAR
ncbi:MAG: tannase/feruloyl esterase family alpha/beta hydrolase [Anaeromyxobacteraceae bacterium]